MAAISITPAILYLAPPYVDCINISLQIFHEHPWQEGREAAAQNQAQLVTKKNKKLDLKFFFFFPPFNPESTRLMFSSVPNRKGGREDSP